MNPTVESITISREHARRVLDVAARSVQCFADALTGQVDQPAAAWLAFEQAMAEMARLPRHTSSDSEQADVDALSCSRLVSANDGAVVFSVSSPPDGRLLRLTIDPTASDETTLRSIAWNALDDAMCPDLRIVAHDEGWCVTLTGGRETTFQVDGAGGAHVTAPSSTMRDIARSGLTFVAAMGRTTTKSDASRAGVGDMARSAATARVSRHARVAELLSGLGQSQASGSSGSGSSGSHSSGPSTPDFTGAESSSADDALDPSRIEHALVGILRDSTNETLDLASDLERIVEHGRAPATAPAETPVAAFSSPPVDPTSVPDKCRGCGATLRANSSFCTACGVSTAPPSAQPSAAPATHTFCTDCGAGLRPGIHYCTACGGAVGR